MQMKDTLRKKVKAQNTEHLALLRCLSTDFGVVAVIVVASTCLPSNDT